MFEKEYIEGYSDEAFRKVVDEHIDYHGHYVWTEIAPIMNALLNVDKTRGFWKNRYYTITKKERQGPAKASQSKASVRLANLFDYILKSLLNKPRSVEYLAETGNSTYYEVLGMIKKIEEDGSYIISKTFEDGKECYAVAKQIVQDKSIYDLSSHQITTLTFGVVSDTHLGTKYEQPSFIHHVYDIFKERGISTVYHVGDITDGYYQQRGDQIYALHALGADRQADYVIRIYPKREGILTYFITGNHDETHIKNGGVDIGRIIATNRPDMIYLGVGSARVRLTPNCIMELYHPLDGSSYAVSYAGQKYMDSLSGGDKPNIIFTGHHHKSMYTFYRNIHYFEVPSMCMQSDWEKRKRLNNEAGAWIVTLQIDEQGSIASISNEFIPQYKKIVNDYLNFKDFHQ